MAYLLGKPCRVVLPSVSEFCRHYSFGTQCLCAVSAGSTSFHAVLVIIIEIECHAAFANRHLPYGRMMPSGER
jgi:hypothetical protein